MDYYYDFCCDFDDTMCQCCKRSDVHIFNISGFPACGKCGWSICDGALRELASHESELNKALIENKYMNRTRTFINLDRDLFYKDKNQKQKNSIIYYFLEKERKKEILRLLRII